MATELPDVEVMDVFVLDEHGRLRTPAPIESDPADVRASAHDAVRQLQAVRATPGHRLGGEPMTVMRAGVGEEISQPVLVDADVALERLADGDLLAELPRLRVDLGSRRLRGSTATWTAHLDTGPPRGERSAVLRLRPTPSRTVTIIELVPVRPRRFGTGSFVRLGVVAVAELADSLRAGSR